MHIFLAWLIFLLALIGLVLPVLAGYRLDGWQKEVTATLSIMGISLVVASLSSLLFKADFMVIFTRTLLFEGLPYGFALRYITKPKKQKGA